MRTWDEAGLIDRCGIHRMDTGWLAERWRQDDSLLFVVDRRGNPRSSLGDAIAFDPCHGDYDEQRHVFLGLWGGKAVFCESVDDESGTPLREMMPVLADEQVLLATEAAAVDHWLRDTRFCSRCGEPLVRTLGGFSQQCTACEAQHFPRHDPAMIVAVTDEDDRLLLAHQSSWAKGRFSVLAGFAEAGESLEQTVHREVAEEVGLALTDVRYVASQPWPFPRSLMFAFTARALSTDIQVDGIEIQEARFFSRAKVRELVADGSMTLAGSASVSAFLIASWLEADAEA